MLCSLKYAACNGMCGYFSGIRPRPRRSVGRSDTGTCDSGRGRRCADGGMFFVQMEDVKRKEVYAPFADKKEELIQVAKSTVGQ